MKKEKKKSSKKGFFTKIKGAFRKWLSAKICPRIIFNGLRIFLYKCCGYKIGKHCFIGMHCYLDDTEPKKIIIGDHVVISYGCYFACHGRNQEPQPIVIKDYAYLGMRCSVISKNREGGIGVTIGRCAVIGACSLVNVDIPDKCTAVGSPCRIIKK